MRCHYIYSSGYMAKNTIIEGYYLNSSGVWTNSANSKEQIVTFADKNLEQVVRDTIQYHLGDSYKEIRDTTLSEGITYEHLGNLHVRDVEKVQYLPPLFKYDTIKDLGGIEYLTNLQGIDMNFTKVSDISPLKGLTKLRRLILGYQGSDISALKGLTNLQELDLNDFSNGNISDISVLKELTNLQKLSLLRDPIRDISALKELINLRELSLSSDQVNDISSLKGLINLQKLCLGGNQINDVSVLGELINLQELDLHANTIKDISSLKKLTNFKNLIYLVVKLVILVH